MTERCLLADYHMHSAFSDDSQAPMEDMVRRALELGLAEICFTEHVDYGVKTVLNCDYPSYLAGAARMREKYGDRITVRAGIEFGVQAETIPQYQTDAQAFPFDFILLSNHQVGNKEFWNGEFQQGKTQAEFHAAYYQAIYNVMEGYQDYSVLAHLDMIKRYDPCGPYPDGPILPIVEQILRRAIQDGKGIEVNTSSFRYGLHDLTPSTRILELYYKLGGRILTIGSDAHAPEHLADHIMEVREVLKKIGFREFCTFDRRQPIFHPL